MLRIRPIKLVLVLDDDRKERVALDYANVRYDTGIEGDTADEVLRELAKRIAALIPDVVDVG